MSTRKFGLLMLCLGLAHLLSLTTRHAALTSNIAIAAAAAGAAYSCWRFSAKMERERATTWRLVSLGLVIWTFAQLIYLTYENILKVTVPTPSISDFVFFVSGIPILLALTLDGKEESSRLLRALDGIQALLTTLLLGFYVWNLAAFTGNDTHALASRLDQIFTAEGILLAAVGLARLFSERHTRLRRDFGMLALFLVVRSACEMAGNAVELYWQIPTGTVFDLVWSAPFLMVSYMAFVCSRAPEVAEERPKQQLRVFVENIGPSLLVLPVLFFSIYIARLHPWIGASAVILSFTISQCRATLVQRLLARTEAARQNSEARFRRVFDQAPLGIAIVDPETGVIKDANAALGRLLDFPFWELRGRRVQDLSISEEGGRLGLPAPGKSGDVWKLERKYRKRDGGVLWAKTTITQMKDPDGGADIRLSMIEDVSAEKRAARFAQARNQILEMIVNNSPVVATLEVLAAAVREYEAGADCVILRAERDGGLGRIAGTNPKRLRIDAWQRLATDEDTLWKQVNALGAAVGYANACSSVVRSGDGEVLGGVALLFEDQRYFTAMDKHLTDTVSRMVALALNHEQIHQQLVFRIHHDAL
ncbi:MAG: PAS domain S-box protein, partial [Acidobacteriales bacterium]|nr:PAS domain S-box protein [Terriglobales bacterium]